MRVRDVEIALVLAREMQAAAQRDVDASLRLEQLREVFGAESLDRGERTRIQTALQMAGLEPQPSLLEADPAEPIRFTPGPGAATATAAPPEPAAAPAQQEFPTVGEFAKSTFGRFRKKRAREEQPEAPAPEPEAPAEAEAAQPTVIAPLPEAQPAAEPEPELEPEAETPATTNGHAANGFAHLDFDGEGLLDDIHLPAHEEIEEHDYEPEVEEPAAEEPQPLPEPEPEPLAPPQQPTAVHAVAAPQPVAPSPDRSGLALLLPIAAVPVLVASFAGWAFGLSFVGLALVATGLLRGSTAPRKVFTALGVVTVASLAVSVLLSAAGSSDNSTAELPAPKAPKASPPVSKPKVATPAAPKPRHERSSSSRHSKPAEKGKREPGKSANPPDDATRGLVRVPPSSNRSGTSTTPGGTSTTPTTTQPGGQQPQQQPGGGTGR